MGLPHDRYVTYLLSRRESEVSSRLEELDLPPLPASELQERKRKLWYPERWTQTLLRSNLPMRRWLSELGVLRAWENPHLLRKALQLLRMPAVRREIEVGVIRGLAFDALRQSILTLSGEELTPDLLQLYTSLFWDLHQVEGRDWRYYFAQRNSREIEEALDWERSHWSRRIDDGAALSNLDYLGDITRMCVARMRQLSDSSSATAAQAMAMLAKVSMDAISQYEEMRMREASRGDEDQFAALWRERFALDTVERSELPVTVAELTDDEQLPVLRGVSGQ